MGTKYVLTTKCDEVLQFKKQAHANEMAAIFDGRITGFDHMVVPYSASPRRRSRFVIEVVSHRTGKFVGYVGEREIDA